MGSSLNQRLTSSIFCAGIGFLVASSAVADYAVDWFKVSSGGGSSQGGDYSLSGTVGQTAVGPMSAGDYNLQVGFWGVPVRVPTSPAPTLIITPTATNTLIFSWPSPNRFVLEETGDLYLGAWTAIAIPPSQLGSRWMVTIPLPVQNTFYRLRFP